MTKPTPPALPKAARHTPGAAAPPAPAGAADAAPVRAGDRRPLEAAMAEGPATPTGKRRAPATVARHIHFFEDGSKRRDYRQIPAPERAVTAALRGEIPFVTRRQADALSDAHFHPTNYVQRGILPAEQLARMKELGIRNCVLMPIPTSLQQVMVEGQPHTAITPELVRRQLGEQGPGHGSHGSSPSSTSSFAFAFAQVQGQPQAFAYAYADAQGRVHAHAHTHHCGAQVYYIPKDVEERVAGPGNKLNFEHLRRNPKIIDEIVEKSVLYVDTAVNSHLAAHLRESGLTQAQRSRLDPMLTGVNLADIRAGEKFLKELYLNKGVFTGIGEITVHKELVQNMYADQKGQATTRRPESLAGLRNLLQMAGAVGAPVVLHCDVDDLADQIRRGMNEEPAHFQGLNALFKDPSVKDTNIVWAHGGGLGRFVQESPGHLDRIGALLHDCPRLHLDISWSEVAKQINKPEALEPWAAFIEKHADRICFGSDSLAPRSADAWDETRRLYQALLSRLSPAAKHNVLNGTYERVFVQARQKVRDFEDQVLTPAFHQAHLMDTEAQQPVSAETVKALAEAARARAR